MQAKLNELDSSITTKNDTLRELKEECLEKREELQRLYNYDPDVDDGQNCACIIS